LSFGSRHGWPVAGSMKLGGVVIGVPSGFLYSKSSSIATISHCLPD
jgi:hypothetical protein